LSNMSWFNHKVRVRYQETDQMGVVYHANYLNWFEIGRTEMIRALGYPYRELEKQGLLLPVVEVNLKFKQPAKYDDVIGIYTRIKSFSPMRIGFEVEIRRLSEQEAAASDLTAIQTEDRTGELLVSGVTEHVWVDHAWKPARIHKQAPELYNLIKAIFDS
jgi:acyl-CoA thioester hydrolase